MKRDLRRLLCCPDCKGDLLLDDETPELPQVETGAFTCAACASRYPIVRGIPRFVSNDQYVGSFSYEWNRWNKVQLDIANGRRESEDTFAEKTGFTPADIRGKLVLDVGCGAGRFLDVVSRWGGEVVGIDLSFAVEASQQSLGTRANVSVIQADVFRLPFRESTFDVIFSIGVLHHSRDTQEAFLQLPSLVKEGGDLAVWLYYYEDKVYNAASDFWRAVLRPFPTTIVYAWCWLLVTLFSDLWRLPIMSRRPWSHLRRVLPVNMHDDRQWRILDTFDWYSPRYQDKDCSPSRVIAWCEQGAIHDVQVLGFPTSIRGRRDTQGRFSLLQRDPRDLQGRRVVVFGAGAAGRQFSETVRRIAPGAVVAFADNDPSKAGTLIGGLPVRGFAEIPRDSYDLVVIASLPGANAIHAQLCEAGLVANMDFVTVDQIHERQHQLSEYGLWAA